MIATVQGMKTCGKCFRLLPAESFHFANKLAKKRHNVCPNCRRQHERDCRRASREKVLCQGLREIRRANSVESMWNATHALITAVGGLDNLMSLVRAQILSEETTPQRRISGARALMHMVEVADKAKSRVLELEVDQLQQELQQLRREESPYDDVF